MKTMAEVLAEHWFSPADYAYCLCGVDMSPDKPVGVHEALADHQAAALSAAGFGLVADAKAEALREAAERFKERSDTYHNTMQEMTGLPDFTAEDITRYGAYSAEANTTATWLRTKPAANGNHRKKTTHETP